VSLFWRAVGFLLTSHSPRLAKGAQRNYHGTKFARLNAPLDNFDGILMFCSLRWPVVIRCLSCRLQRPYPSKVGSQSPRDLLLWWVSYCGSSAGRADGPSSAAGQRGALAL